jgi:hypothetical protein
MRLNAGSRAFSMRMASCKRRLSDPEANTILGLASGGRGADSFAGANRPTSALARLQPSAVSASGFWVPSGHESGAAIAIWLLRVADKYEFPELSRVPKRFRIRAAGVVRLERPMPQASSLAFARLLWLRYVSNFCRRSLALIRDEVR